MVVTQIENNSYVRVSNYDGLLDKAKSKCLFYGDSCLEQTFRITDLSGIKSNCSTNTLLSILNKVVSSNRSLSPDDHICGACADSLQKLDELNTQAKQLEQRLLQRYLNDRRAQGTVAAVSPVSGALQAARQLDHGTTMDVSSSLSVTMMREPPPKRRCLGISAEEFFNPSGARQHCCDYTCTHVTPRHVSLDRRTEQLSKSSSQDAEIASLCHKNGNTFRSIKCSVGDLDKSHISSILRTPTRNLWKNNDMCSNSPISFTDTASMEATTACATLPQHLPGASTRRDPTADGSVRIVRIDGESEDCSSSSCSSSTTSDSSADMEDNVRLYSGELLPAVSSTVGTATSLAAAQAMLLQIPEASSLLHSFLSASLWLQQQLPAQEDVEQRGDDGEDSDTPQEQVNDDVTCESLSVSASAVQDKSTRQELKNTGQSYINTKGKMVEAKRVAPQDCSKCVLRCSAKLSEEDRQSVFAEYWGLADYGKQREYLAQHMHREERLGPSGLTRTVVLYYLTHTEKVQVCRQFFLKTLDVSEKASRIVLEKKVRGEFGTIGAPPPPPTHRTTSSRSRRTVANNQDSDYEY